MSQASPFIDLAAVECWDTWFRWRECDALRDVSIQDTWARVVQVVACPSSGAADPRMEQRLFDAMAAWRLLPDERILSTAGTGHQTWPANELVAVLNIARFVCESGLPSAHLDMASIEATAGLAVEMLDNAAEVARWSPGRSGVHLRIGVIGLADALLLLGIAYGSVHALRIAHDVARQVAAGCLDASLRLARDRGARCQVSQHHPVAYKLRELSPSLAADVARHGLRQSNLTAITSQIRLAQLANNVTNAVDPLPQPDWLAGTGEPGESRVGASLGYAIEWSRHHGANPARLGVCFDDNDTSIHAQIALRSSMQMWIDEPILYALSADQPDGAAVLAAGAARDERKLD